MKSLILAIVVTCSCTAFGKRNSSPCKTPNEEDALCVPISECAILKAAADTGDPSKTKFVQASKCGNSNSMVCCGTAQRFTKNYVIKHLVPKKTFCGMQHTDDYYYTEMATSIDEFPWMIYIPVKSYMKGDRNIEIRCAGVLISPQYVLTMRACAAKYFDSVMIGQYNRHQNVSCVETSYGPDCTEPAIQKKVTEKHILGQNILLLRLESRVSYSDYVRPICLPLEDSDKPKKGDEIVVSGWGEKTFGGQTLKIKKRIKNILLDEDECKNYNNKKDFPYDNSLCLSTEKNSSTLICSGDDGGPLMYKSQNNWFVEGIVTAFTTGCFNTEEIIPCEGIQGVLDNILELMYP